MCRCSEVPIRNFFTILAEQATSFTEHYQWHNLRVAIGYATPPEMVAKDWMDDPSSVPDKLKFDEKICHVCQNVTPDSTYCVPMYGSRFKQKWGWYIRQEEYRQFYHDTKFLSPPHVTDRTRELVPTIQTLRQQWSDLPDIMGLTADERERKHELERQLRKMERQLENEFENIVRLKVGYKPIGSRFVSETLMYSLVCEIFSGDSVLRHHRPAWLAGLELDVFVPDHCVAFEYQGIQHFQPLPAWGGIESFNALIERDRRKKELCSSHGITLIEIRYDEELTTTLIQRKLGSML